MSSIWNSSLSYLEDTIPENDLNTWIRPLQAQEKKEVITLLAPNQFIITHVKDHFLSKIEDAIYEISDGQYTVKMEIGTKNIELAIITDKNTRTANPINKTPTFINTTFTFDNFVEGKSNQLAKAASIQVSKNIGKAYNPLLIYGASGLGKTHLMHATGNAMLANNANANVVYLHSEKFVQDMVKALQQNSIHAFKKYYRNIDALFIDDIQFFAGKERSQEEFFHTFNALLEKNNQIVLTCDKYPKEIDGLEDRLKSRFGYGLPIAIEPPDLETRAAILINKAQQSNIELTHEVAFFIGDRIPSNVRELEGALRRLIANAQFTGADITIAFAKESLYDLMSLQDKLVSINRIQKTVAEYFKIRVADILSKNRQQLVTRPRQIAMSLTRELTNHSLPEIGDAFSGRDHTTVINACKRIKELRSSNYKVKEDYANLLRTLSH